MVSKMKPYTSRVSLDLRENSFKRAMAWASALILVVLARNIQKDSELAHIKKKEKHFWPFSCFLVWHFRDAFGTTRSQHAKMNGMLL